MKKKIMFSILILVSVLLFLPSCGTKEYDIVFTDYDDTELCTLKVKEGEMPVFASLSIPSRPNDENYSYKFSRWYPEITEATEDKVYKALYVRSMRQNYTITFKNYDGETLKVTSVKEGDTPVYDSDEDPVRPNDSEGSYKFAGWDNVLAPATENATYTATYRKGDLPTYKVIFRDEDSKVLDTVYVEEGSTPAYTKELPTKASDEDHVYVFDNWTNELVPAYESATYIAQYKACDYPYYVSFDLDGGATQENTDTIKLEKINSDIFPLDVTKPNHKFAGWSINGELVYDTQGNKVKDYELSPKMTFKAAYENKCTIAIQYLAWNPITDAEIGTYYQVPTKAGEGSLSRYCDWNQNIDLSIKLNEGYTFDGWYQDGTKINENKSFKYTVWEEDAVLTAKYICDQHEVTVRTNNTNNGSTCIKGIDTLWHDEQKMDAYTSQEFSVTANTTGDKEFVGWYDSKNKLLTTSQFLTFDMASEDYVVEARWNYFTLDYDGSDDRGAFGDLTNLPAYYTTNSQTIALPTPTTIRFGYEFIGWKTENDYLYEIDPKDTRNMSLVASYKKRDDLAMFNFTDEKHITGFDQQYISGMNSIEITIPDDIVAIDEYAFRYSSIITKATLGSGITKIEEGTFKECRNMKSINLEGIEEIGSDAFDQCNSLTNITFGQIKKIKIGAFSYTHLASVTLPSSITELGGEIFMGCSELKTAIVNITLTTLPNKIFEDCESLTSVTLPNTIKTIGDNAFYKCSKLETITLPTALEVIGDYAFGKCFKLSSITFPGNVTEIGAHAFEFCDTLTTVTLPNITTIDSYTLYYCNHLTTVVLPKSVTTVSIYAFDGCREFDKVYFMGSKTEWNVTIFSHNDMFTSATRYYLTTNGASETASGNWWYYDTDGKTIIEKVVE